MNNPRLFLTALVLSFTVLPITFAADAPSPYEARMADPDAPADPAYLPRGDWDEALRGPLPRYRLGPNGENATPAPGPNQRLTPYAIELRQTDFAPDNCVLGSPPEYSPTEGVIYRYATGTWDGIVTDMVAELTGDPTKDEIAYVVVANSTQESNATSDFIAAGADMSKVQFIEMPTNSIWMRDYGPHFTWQGGARTIVDSHYYPGRANDNFIPTLLGDDYFVEPSYDIPLYYSGGNFMPAMNGDAFMTALINADNPGFGEPYIASLYQQYQGINTIHVLPQLPPSVDGTGHIDMWMYLIDEDTVIIGEFIPGSDPTATTITNDAVPYMESLGYTVYRVPAFNDSHAQGSAHYTYTNAYRVNDRIFVPTYGAGDPAYLSYDNQAIATWEAAVGPSIEIVPIDSYDIIYASGAIHCIVMQVPRYTDSNPSACATSPGGGELLVPSTVRDITWAATDDSAISAIDLSYSVDGGASWPPSQIIATGLADTGTYAWTIPQIESTQARVRVVATDDASNSVTTESEFDVQLESALQSLYDFSTGGNVDKWVHGTTTTSWSVMDGVRKPVELTQTLQAAQHSRLAVSDATGDDSDPNRYISPLPGFGSETTHVFEITINEPVSQILDIGILWEGYVDDSAQMELYVWNLVQNQWCDGIGNCGENQFMNTFAGNRDENITAHLQGDFSDYIDGNGLLTLLLYSDRDRNRSYHDYFSLTVTYDPCSGADVDFDGYGSVCDNCVNVANPTQIDTDADSAGDACDCAVSDGTVFAVPTEIENVTILSDTTTLSWASNAGQSGSSTVYDVMRGDLGEYPVGSGAGETCEGTAIAGTSLGGLPPPTGAGQYYLVRGSNSCGTGNYGFDSDSQPRNTTACP